MKIGSIEDFDKNPDEKKTFQSQNYYRIRVEKYPKENGHRYYIEMADKVFVCPPNIKSETILDWSLAWSGWFNTLTSAQDYILELIEREKIISGYYIKEYIKFPEDQNY